VTSRDSISDWVYIVSMDGRFFEKPILNSPYAHPARHWELDEHGQSTHRIVEARRIAQFITPIPKPRKVKKGAVQESLVLDEGVGLSTAGQMYDPTPVINELRRRLASEGVRFLVGNRRGSSRCDLAALRDVHHPKTKGSIVG
jgi:hypothetical protein